MSLKNHILRTYEKKIQRNWDTIYWAVDIHDTCVAANYKSGEIPTQFFEHAERVLRRISDRPDSKLILFTCSHPHEIDQYLKFFSDKGIIFNYTNENPEAENTSYGFYEKKFYCQILLDDKAGFDATEDWAEIDYTLDIIDQKYPNT